MRKVKKLEGLKTFFSTFFSYYKSAEIEITSVAVAYYLLISIFPILLTLANLLPYFPFDVDAILSVLAEFIPEKIYPTVSNFVTNILTKPSSSWLGIAILTTLWTLSNSMMILQKAVNKAYGMENHRDVIVGRLVGIFLGIGLQIIIGLSIASVTFGQAIFSYIDKYFNLENGWLDIILGQTQPIAYLALFAALIMFYYFSPNVRIPKIWYVFPGAAFVLFIMATTGKLFSLYLDNYANRIIDFRSATAVIFLVFMVWFIFMAQILIIGAVVNASVHKLKLVDIQSRDGDIVSIFKRAKAKYKKTSNPS
ncbi:TPA: YihY/virulence factor BrkB family protein [Streptococcus suis]